MATPPPFITSQDISGLLQAARNGNIGLVTGYLDRFGEKIVNRKGPDDVCALSAAAEKGYINTVALLLERGADINLPGGHQKTALHWAAEKGHHPTVILLLEKGASTTLKDRDGRTAAELAKKNRHPDIEMYIKQWPERQRKKDRQSQEKDEKLTQARAEARLEELKKHRPAKPLLKRNPPRP